MLSDVLNSEVKRLHVLGGYRKNDCQEVKPHHFHVFSGIKVPRSKNLLTLWLYNMQCISNHCQTPRESAAVLISIKRNRKSNHIHSSDILHNRKVKEISEFLVVKPHCDITFPMESRHCWWWWKGWNGMAEDLNTWNVEQDVWWA